MADVIDGLARKIVADATGVTFTWDTTGHYDGTTVGITDTALPPKLAEVVVLTLYPGGDTGEDDRNAWTEPRLQVRTRAGTDPRRARVIDAAVHTVLHALGPVVLEDGTDLTDCYSLQSAAMPLGQDSSGRWEFSRNYQLTIQH